MTNKLCQKQQIFYRLLLNRKQSPTKYVPIWQFIGEFNIPEMGQWGFISYEVSARMSEIWREMPAGIIERDMVTGKSGARYFAYRIHPALNRAALLAYANIPQKYVDVINLLQ